MTLRQPIRRPCGQTRHSQSDWGRGMLGKQGFVKHSKHLCQNCIEVLKQSETSLHSDTCWPTWVSPHVLCSELMQRSPAQFQTHLLYQPVNNCDQHKLWRNCPTNIKRKILTLLKTASCDGEEQCASEKFFNTHEAVSAAQQK